MRLFVQLLTLLWALPEVSSFTVGTDSRPLRCARHPPRPKLAVYAMVDDHDGTRRRLDEESSQMNSYINRFLGKEAMDDSGKATDNTFIIALPCESCHELQIQLESVQRAIVYNCPVAVHACLPTSSTRVPLLSVRGDVSVRVLRDIVAKVIRDHYDDMISLRFVGLDVEPGALSDNEILHAMIVSDDGTQPPQREDPDQVVGVAAAAADDAANKNSSIGQLADRLNRSILNETSCDTSVSTDFRVPFMKLPPDWNELVNGQSTTDCTTPEYGGNGISPLHWIDWSEDRFGEPQRMREIALYQETGKFPIATIPFPNSSVRNANELKWEKYQDERMMEVERKLKDKNSATKEGSSSNDEFMLRLTRERLEKLYEHSGSQEEDESRLIEEEIPAQEEDLVKTESAKTTTTSSNQDDHEDWSDIQNELLQDPQRETDPNAVDDWMRLRIRNIIDAKSNTRAAATAAKKDMASVEENELFAKYRRGELTTEPQQVVPGKAALPPFPSREHCTGIWRMNTSPTGFEIEEANENRSENIILRVDGTISGGPILDKETRQKASGGTWRLETTADNRGELEVRLLIPPNKARVLVMRGAIARPTVADLPLAGKTFGIPAIDDKAKAAGANDSEVIECYGTVWLEDAITRNNKNDIGDFSMTKVSDLLDPSQFTVTIPKNVRFLD